MKTPPFDKRVDALPLALRVAYAAGFVEQLSIAEPVKRAIVAVLLAAAEAEAGR